MISYTHLQAELFCSGELIFALRLEFKCFINLFFILYFLSRFLLSTNDDEVIKHLLAFIHILSEACGDAIFSLAYLERNLVDLIIPLAKEEVHFLQLLSFF